MVKKRKPGAQPGNRNGATHCGYLKKFDGRTKLGKLQAQVEGALHAALGDVTPQEALLVQRVA